MKSKGGRKTVVDRLLSQRIVNIFSREPGKDIESLVEALREAFPEYNRQKRQPFTWQVRGAVTSLRDDGVLPLPVSQTGTGVEDMSDSDAVADADRQQQSSLNLNTAVTRMYGKQAGAQEAQGGSPEGGDPTTRPPLSGQPATSDAAAVPDTSEGKAPTASGRKATSARSKRARSNADEDAVPRRPRKSAAVTPKPVFYRDLGGIEDVLHDIQQLIEYPLKHPEVYAWLGVEPPRGVLLYGPPGCGKTALANAIANECSVPFFRISAPEVVSGMSGESEAKLRSLFAEAAAAAPAILFIDEIDAIAPKREVAQREMERRIVAQMLTCMDDLCQLAPDPGTSETEAQAARPVNSQRHVIVIGATNRPDALDAALRRAGRFDREIALSIPTEAARAQILGVLCRGLRLSGDFDHATIARSTPGFVGADLTALTKEAAAIAVSRIFDSLQSSSMDAQQGTRALGAAPLSSEALEGLAITMQDFRAAVAKVQPSVRREGFSTKPDVTWDDVGALEDIREELHFAITEPIRHPEAFAALGLTFAAGVLLFGPPGCGKTLLAKAAASASGANFISIKGPELLNKYVGESERAVRSLFARATAAKPCVLFFDELDALAPRRGGGSGDSSGGGAGERIVNQLLTEMDGVSSREGVYLIGATNRPDIIDPALLRPGRLDKTLYVPLPDPKGRGRILQALARKSPVASDVDLVAIASAPQCEGFSGADMAALLREAAVICLKCSMKASTAAPLPGGPAGAVSLGQAPISPVIQEQHFQAALQSVRPSVSPRDARTYERLRSKLLAARSHISTEQASAPKPTPTDAGTVPDGSNAALADGTDAQDMDVT